MMSNMTLYIIANPHAGNKNASTIVGKIQELYHTEDISVFYTEQKDDEKKQVINILRSFKESDHLMIIGGDGTLSIISPNIFRALIILLVREMILPEL